jgi:hypothetical protein
VVFSDEHRTIAEVGPILVFIATSAASPDHVQRVERALSSLIKRHPKGVAYLQVVDTLPGEARRIPEETRKAFVEFARNAPALARCAGIALLAEGFVAAAMRGVAAAALGAMRTAMPLSVFGSVEDTCAWIEATCKKTDTPIPTARDLASAVHTLRGAMRSKK